MKFTATDGTPINLYHDASLSDLHAKIRIPIRPGRSADEASCEVDA